MTYYYHLKNVRTGKTTLYGSFTELTVGDEIVWGIDKDSEDGKAHWIVMDFVCSTDLKKNNEKPWVKKEYC